MCARHLDKLWHKGKEFLNVPYPIMCGAMTWVSEHNLVSIVSENGAFGVLAAGNMPPETIAEEIKLTRQKTAKPFAVNLITIAPNYHKHLDLVCDMKVPYAIFAGSFPHSHEIKRVKSCGIKTVCFASADSIAQRMIEFGADALILEGSEAGGHIGPVSSMVLLQQVLFKIKNIPIFVAGGIATGKMIAHLLLMGASGCQLGTRFVMSDECKAHPDFKEMFRKSKARDAVATPQFDSALPVVPVRAIKNEGTARFEKLQFELLQKIQTGAITKKDAQFEVEKFWVGALRKAVIEGDVKNGSVMAGQSVGLVDEIKSIKDIITELVTDAETELDYLIKRLED